MAVTILAWEHNNRCTAMAKDPYLHISGQHMAVMTELLNLHSITPHLLIYILLYS